MIVRCQSPKHLSQPVHAIELDPLEAGLLGLPFSVGVVVSTWIAQRALPRLGPRTVTTIGFALAAIGTGSVDPRNLSADPSLPPDFTPEVSTASRWNGLMTDISAIHRAISSV